MLQRVATHDYLTISISMAFSHDAAIFGEQKLQCSNHGSIESIIGLGDRQGCSALLIARAGGQGLFAGQGFPQARFFDRG